MFEETWEPQPIIQELYCFHDILRGLKPLDILRHFKFLIKVVTL